MQRRLDMLHFKKMGVQMWRILIHFYRNRKSNYS